MMPTRPNFAKKTITRRDYRRFAVFRYLTMALCFVLSLPLSALTQNLHYSSTAPAKNNPSPFVARPLSPFLEKTSQSYKDPSEFLRDYLWHEFINQRPERRPKIAVVLSGGGARGFSHIGVLRVLEKNRLPVDIVVGASIGAVVGALYASGFPLDKLEYIASDLGWDKISDFKGAPTVVDLVVGERLLSSEKLEKYLEARLGAKNFHELPKKFACVAVDIVTGEKIIFSEGNVARAVRASATMPGVFEPVQYRHRLLVDGGLVDNIPVDLARSMGADIVIALTARTDYTNNSVKGVLRALTQAIYIQGRILEDDSLRRADFIIAPDVKDVSALDLARAAECIGAGVIEAESRVEELKEFIIKKILAADKGAEIFLP